MTTSFLPAAAMDQGVMSHFAETILRNKNYTHDLGGGRYETWPQAAERVVRSVMEPYLPDLVERTLKLVTERKFVPGGRYLYAAGRKFPQCNNCFLFSCKEDSRQEWGRIAHDVLNALMTGGGVGVVYSKLRAENVIINGLGGKSTGPCALMNIINEQGRYVRQGGSRRSAIWAGLHWNHADIFKFIGLKDWSETIRRCREEDYNFPAPMDGTNVSVILDDDFFAAYHDETNRMHDHAHNVFWTAIRHMLRTGEPGFSIDIGENAGEHLRNAPVSAYTKVLVGRSKSDTEGLYVQVGDIVGREVLLWTRTDWVPATFTKTRSNDPTVVVHMSNGKYITCSLDHEFILDTGERIQARNLQEGDSLMVSPPYGEAKQTRVTHVVNGATQDVFCCDVKVVDHSFMAEGVIISNCTEVTTADDSDMCNLGSANMGRLRSIDEFQEVVECGTAFLLCGTIYSKLPLESMHKVREKNRRIGLGLMGVHEWLLRRGMPYAPSDQLGEWMRVYRMSGAIAHRYADKLGISRPIATRSIAPTGTISIIAETTSGIEPIYAVALKRRYLEGVTWKAQYIIDPAAKRLIDAGVDPNSIEDAYALAEDVERRVSFQAWLQSHVDHGISSTINLPPWGSSLNNESTVTQFGRRLMEYLPKLRGITAYPDGCRGGQPLNRVPYTEAVKHVGTSFIEEANEEYSNGASCKGGVCGE